MSALSYSFGNICGASFEGGQVAFSTNGDILAVPCGNRVTLNDLRYNKVLTLPFQAKKNIRHIVFSARDPIWIVIDEDGRGLVVNAVKNIALARPNFKGTVTCAKFSPCGSYFAVSTERTLRIYYAPNASTQWQMIPFRTVRNHLNRIVYIDWSMDSRFLCTSSNDHTIRLISRDGEIEGFVPITFVDHRHPIKGAFFSHDMRRIFSVAKDGTMISWRWVVNSHSDDNEGDENDTTGKPAGLCLNRTFLNNGPTLNSHRSLRKKKKICLEKINLADSQNNNQDKNSGDVSNDINVKTESDSNVKSLLGTTVDYINGNWVVEKKGFCNQPRGTFVNRTTFLNKTGLLLVGFTNGSISLYDMPELNSLYSLSISEQPTTTLAISSDGEWIAVGCSESAQLVVWEWRSESFIMKQQGHHGSVRCVACSSVVDSLSQSRLGGTNSRLGLGNHNLIVATGGEDGKLKLWDTSTGFNYMTFTEHTAAINALVFTPQGNAVLAASSDGTVRAFDLMRYRNFRTFLASTEGTSFIGIAVDSAGETVVAAAHGDQSYSVYTGKLLETLAGHEGPVSCIEFHPHPDKCGILMSASWDGTIRIWDIFGRVGKSGAAETLVNQSGILSATFDPRGNNQLAAATYSGNIWFWDLEEGAILGSVAGLRDIRSGRCRNSYFAVNNTRGLASLSTRATGSVGHNVNQNQHFTTLAYSSNGNWLFAGSRSSARICVYDTGYRQLVHVYSLTANQSLDGIKMELNSKLMTECGVPLDSFDLSNSEGDEDETMAKSKQIAAHKALPGVKLGDLKGRMHYKEFNVWQVVTSQDGQLWCAATSHGLYTYTVNMKGGTLQGTDIMQLEKFAPTLITRNVNRSSIDIALKEGHVSKAMILALALNDFSLLNSVYGTIGYKSIAVVVQSIPPFLLPPLLNFIRVKLTSMIKAGTSASMKQQYSTTTGVVEEVENSDLYIQFHIRWLSTILSIHSATLQHLRLSSIQNDTTTPNDSTEMSILKHLGATHGDLLTLCLLLLRNIQHLHSNLDTLFGSNLHTLNFLLQTINHDIRKHLHQKIQQYILLRAWIKTTEFYPPYM